MGSPINEDHPADSQAKRAKRQFGHKRPKYVMRVEAVDSLAPIGLGKGGYWEDRAGHQ